MAPPSYTPLAAQQQNQGGSVGGITNPDGSPLTPQQQQAYYQWLMQRGQGGQPQQVTPKGQSVSGTDAVQGGLLKKLLGSSAGNGSMGDGVAVGPVASGEAYGGMLTSNIGPVASGEMYGGELAANSAAAQPFMGVGAGPAAGIAAATILGGRYGLRALQGKTKNWKDASLADNAGRVITGIATGGLSEVANKLLGGHKTTRETQKGVTSDLLSQFKDDPQYQAFVSGMRKQYEAPPPDPSKPFAGKYATFDEYKKAGLQANDLTGTEGAIRGGGAEYTKLSPEQQQAYTQALINADQFQSGHGGVGVKDLATAQKIFEDVKAAGFKANTKSAPSTKGMAVSTLPLRIPQVSAAPIMGVPRVPVGVLGQPEQAQTMIPGRSKTRSPGIDLQGRRLKY